MISYMCLGERAVNMAHISFRYRLDRTDNICLRHLHSCMHMFVYACGHLLLHMHISKAVLATVLKKATSKSASFF